MSFRPNKLGLYDMSGNVWEFCEDWHDGAKTVRVLRGASWHDAARIHLLSSGRYKLAPDTIDVCAGFRLVLAPGSAPVQTTQNAAPPMLKTRG